MKGSAIVVKTQEEVAALRTSGRVAAQILAELVAAAQPGVATAELDRLARQRIRATGSRPAFLGYEGFPAVVCTSVNAIAVHGPPSDYILKRGDLLGIDFGVIVDGWYSDVAVSIPIGSVSPEAQRLLAVTEEALAIGIAKAQPGNRVGDISAAIQQHVERAGFEVIRELTGHGVGRGLHEPPQIPNVGEVGSGPELVEGMVIAIEPITSMSAQHVRLSRDGFGYETVDGSLAAHFEHTVAITRHGPEVLTPLKASFPPR